MSKDSFVQVAVYLKQAVSLMLKYQIPPNNYPLWYGYVSGNLLELNSAIDLEMDGLIHNRQPFALLLADIDRFKSFNDEYNQLLGTRVLRIVGKRLREVSKEGIAAYRLGGEEFALLALTRQMAESLRRAIERMSILDRKSGRRIDHITASFGVGNPMVRRRATPGRAHRQAVLPGQETRTHRVMPQPS